MKDLLKPPQATVYTKDFEVLGIIEMKPDMYDYFLKYDRVRFPIMQVTMQLEDDPMQPPNFVFAELSSKFIKLAEDKAAILLFAENEETCLLMTNVFAPGQTKELQLQKMQYFIKGFAMAINKRGDTTQ
jgi:hypothetical protein